MVIIIPRKKYTNPFSSSFLLHLLKKAEIKKILRYLSILKSISTNITMAMQIIIKRVGLKNQLRKTIKMPDA
jgi:hypothetical protein